MRFMRLSCQNNAADLIAGMYKIILPSWGQGNWIVLSMNRIAILKSFRFFCRSSPDLHFLLCTQKMEQHQWILAFQLFQNAIRKRLWKYRQIFLFSAKTHATSACSPRQIKSVSDCFFCQSSSEDEKDSLFFPRNESITSISQLWSKAAEWNLSLFSTRQHLVKVIIIALKLDGKP